VIGASVVGAAGLIAGCGGNGGDGDGDGGQSGGATTTVSGDDTPTASEDASPTMTPNALEQLNGAGGGSSAKAWEERTQRFKEQYPDLAVEINSTGGQGNVTLDQVVARRMANRNPPDAFSNWIGQNITKYGGRLGSITSVWDENGFQDAFNPMLAELAKLNGEFRAVPQNSHRLNNLFYNIEVFEEAGVDPDSITSHADLISAFEEIQGNTDAVPMAHGMSAPWTNLQLWAQVMLGEEGMDAYMNAMNGEGDMDKIVAALEKTQEILENYINEDASTLGFVEANQKVVRGEAATIHQGSWAFGQYRDNDSFNFREHWGWMEYPGTEDMYTLHCSGQLFTRDSDAPRKQEIWAEFVGSKEEQLLFNDTLGSAPTRPDVDTSQLHEFPAQNAEHLGSKSQFPPTIAHGLAVPPENLSLSKEAIGNNFMGPFDAEAAAQSLMDAVSRPG